MRFAHLISLLFAITMTLAAPARAEPVALMIWVDDGKALDIEHRSAAIANFREAQPALPIRTLTTTKRRLKKDLGAIEGHLHPDDEISVLILATHGETQIRKNRTQLQGLGEFGVDGASGPLKDLIEDLGRSRHFGLNLHVFLDACATCRGSEKAVQARMEGLTRDFNRVGVKNVSVWGARQPMRAAGYRNQPLGPVVKSLAKKIGLMLAPGPAFGLVVFPAAWAAYGFDAEVAYRLLSAAKLVGVVYGLIVAQAILIYAWPLMRQDNSGFLYVNADGAVKLIDMETTDPRIRIGTCATSLD